MKLAIVSTGLGRVIRGFESFTESLFTALERYAQGLDVTLFQGGGNGGQRRIVVPNFHRSDLPGKWLSSLQASHLEKRSFAVALYPWLRIGKYDLVHYNELTCGSALFHLRRLFGGEYRLIYCNGAPSPAIHYYHRCDFAQLLTRPDYEEAQKFGVAEERLFGIPYGVDGEVFHPSVRAQRTAVRTEIGIPDDVRVVLSLAAIKSEHKRIDYLIREVAQTGPDVWLLVAGQRTQETAQLEGLAESLIPGRWRFVSWPHSRVPELCGASDIFVLCSLTEAFGLVTIEAMLSGLPTVLHNGPVFRWLTDGAETKLVNMSEPGQLSSALAEYLSAIAGDVSLPKRLAAARGVVEKRFAWESLTPAYIRMYETAAKCSV